MPQLLVKLFHRAMALSNNGQNVNYCRIHQVIRPTERMIARTNIKMTVAQPWDHTNG